MFELLKRDVAIGDTIRLYLTTGKEPEGTVLELGDHFILIKDKDGRNQRFLDKLIGGWDTLGQVTNIIVTGSSEDNSSVALTTTKTPSSLLQALKEALPKTLLSKKLRPNAEIYYVGREWCFAKNKSYVKIFIDKRNIISAEVLVKASELQKSETIPVFMTIRSDATKGPSASFVISPTTILRLLEELESLIASRELVKANFIINTLKNPLDEFSDFKHFIKEIESILKEPKQIEPRDFRKDEAIDFKHLEKSVNDLIRQAKFQDALEQINDVLNALPEKYKSSFLLKRAQIFSSLNQPGESERAYQELIAFNEKLGTPRNNLSHLYMELGRIQSLNPSKLENAISSITRALEYNPSNNLASNLLRQISRHRHQIVSESHLDQQGQLIIDEMDDGGSISKLIDIDIKEHKFNHPDILKNGGDCTPYLAKRILEEGKKNRDIDISERYPVYLEAAKAFSELNVGSYDLQDYQEAAAYYSMLKGNSLFIRFRKTVLEGDIDLNLLTRIKDSACSYFLEALNLLSNIDQKPLLTILTNYFKLQITEHLLRTKRRSADFQSLFRISFSDLFNFCLRSDDPFAEKIAFKTIVDCGAASINAWNKLNNVQKGMGVLYGQFKQEKRAREIFLLINEMEQYAIDVNLKPSQFLKAAFLKRRDHRNRLLEFGSQLQLEKFEPTNFQNIKNLWQNASPLYSILTDTDQETAGEIEKLISILQPYLNRNETERTNILLQARSIIERQQKFINDNTTFYGRSFFYGLITKWKKELDALLQVKILQSFPSLRIIIDPPYFLESDGQPHVPIIVKNEGETTADGFELNIVMDSIVYDEGIVKSTFRSSDELKAGGMIEMYIPVDPSVLEDSNAFELKIAAQAIYQGEKIDFQEFEFTVEKQPESTLSYEEIPWKDGPIPSEHLFKGRSGLITELTNHYLSVNRDKPFILYGLTRTGKSSILKFLQDEIAGKHFVLKNGKREIFPVQWNLQEISNSSNAREFYTTILNEGIMLSLQKKLQGQGEWDDSFQINDRGQFKDFKRILEFIQEKKLFPIFFVDELSYIKDLMDRNVIGPGFLAALREYSLNGLASFIFAGTYDIKKLISEERYGITGQFVHAIEHQVDKIDKEAATELIEVIDDKLSFTPEAVDHILHLSGQIPYFIQIICKSCGDYAVENNRRFIGYPELEKVIRIIIGKEFVKGSTVSRLTPGKFQNNQVSTSDPEEVKVLMSSIAYFNEDSIMPRGVGFHELERLWHEKKLSSFKSKLAGSIQNLLEKKILYQEYDESIPVYKFSVDLFRRWWYHQHQDINLELTTLSQDV